MKWIRTTFLILCAIASQANAQRAVSDPHPPAAGSAAASTSGASKSDASPSSLDVSPMRWVAIAGLMAGLIYLTSYGLKRFARRTKMSGEGRNMRVIESLPLGGKRMLVVAEVYGRRLLLGMADGRVELLKELPEEEPLLARSRKPVGAARFRELLERHAAEADREEPPSMERAASETLAPRSPKPGSRGSAPKPEQRRDGKVTVDALL